MILVTGGTGFVGRVLLRRLMEERQDVGCLLRPAGHDRRLPSGKVHLAAGTLQDLPSLRLALKDVETVIHLVGAHREQEGYSAEWLNEQGTRNLIGAALDCGVEHMIYLSHIRANPNSAYPVLRSKGAAEDAVRNSGMTYTVLRSSLIFGPGDPFTSILAMLLKVIPFVFPVMGDGKARFQPIYVEDVARCLAACVESYPMQNVTLDIGGPQHLSYNEILDAMMEALDVWRLRLYLRRPLMRGLVRLSGLLLPNPPVSLEQLDLFAINNTTDLSNVPHHFDFEPRRFAENLSYLQEGGWRRAFLRSQGVLT